MAIKLQLPRKAAGQEILNAFRTAATFQESTAIRWEAYEYSTPSNGDGDAENTFIAKRGCRATPLYLSRQGRISCFLFGRRDPVWRTCEGLNAMFLTQVQLQPISPDEKYSEVQIDVHHEYDPDPTGGFRIVSSPDERVFIPFRAAYDKIVREFLQRLA